MKTDTIISRLLFYIEIVMKLHQRIFRAKHAIIACLGKRGLEPYVLKRTSTVLRRERGSNPSNLADKLKQ